MARKRKGRSRPPKILQYELALTVGALASNDVIGTTSPPTVQDRTFLIGHKGTWSTRNFTVGEGPIAFGVAHSDVSDAEIETYLEQTAGWFESDIAAKLNRGFGRYIKRVGVFDLSLVDQSLNDGVALYTKLGFTVNEDEGLNIWTRNQSGAILTTGGVILTEGFVMARNA